jgi:hypothetical protein
MRQEPTDMATSELVCELAAFTRRAANCDDLSREDWERHRAVAAELDRRIPRPA